MSPVQRSYLQYLSGLQSDALPILEYWDRSFINGYIVAEILTKIEPKCKPEEWNIYEKIVKREETSTCKLEAWHQKLDKILMKPHPSFDDFCKVLMAEWVRILSLIIWQVATVEVILNS